MTGERNKELFDEMVRQTIDRRLRAGDSELLLDTLGFLIQRERLKSANDGGVPIHVIT